MAEHNSSPAERDRVEHQMHEKRFGVFVASDGQSNVPTAAARANSTQVPTGNTNRHTSLGTLLASSQTRPPSVADMGVSLADQHQPMDCLSHQQASVLLASYPHQLHTNPATRALYCPLFAQNDDKNQSFPHRQNISTSIDSSAVEMVRPTHETLSSSSTTEFLLGSQNPQPLVPREDQTDQVAVPTSPLREYLHLPQQQQATHHQQDPMLLIQNVAHLSQLGHSWVLPQSTSMPPNLRGLYSAERTLPTRFGLSPEYHARAYAHTNNGMGTHTGSLPSKQHTAVNIPPCQEGPLPHFTVRRILPLASEEDENWLSEFFCFVRSDMVEVFGASREDVASRMNTKTVNHGQIGIRCRFCAHLSHRERAGRSSSFPSSISRIYQSLTMMLRDHFTKCGAMPPHVKEKFYMLKTQTSQGATDSKRYWIESATKLGMVDTAQGIIFVDQNQNPPNFSPHADSLLAPNPSILQFPAVDPAPSPLVFPEERSIASEYLYTLMSQVQRVFLVESERVGNRRSLEVGLPGFGCKHCLHRGGLGRLFPASQRTLPSKVKYLHEHIMRCSLCPVGVKFDLSTLLQKHQEHPPDDESQKVFFDRVWKRLYSEVPPKNSSV